jgi:cysteine synthase A
VDAILPINGADALRLSRQLATMEGIFTGISGGATFAAALQVAAKAPDGSRILCMLPDTGERYLSTPLFDDIVVDMSDEEIAISHSTPNHRFDKTADVPQATGSEEAAATAEARAFVKEAIESVEQPVVLFALEWCEFCWAVRKLFARCRIDYRAVDIDSVAFQGDNLGGKIRTALTERSGVATIPQVFVAGSLVGGASDTFAAFAKGDLQALLEKNGIAYEDTVGDKLYSLMPGWVQR